ELQEEIDTDEFDRNHPMRYIRITPANETTTVTAGNPELDPDAPDAPSVLRATATTARGTHVEVWSTAETVKQSVIRASLRIASLSLLAIGVAVGLPMFYARRLPLALMDPAAPARPVRP